MDIQICYKGVLECEDEMEICRMVHMEVGKFCIPHECRIKVSVRVWLRPDAGNARRCKFQIKYLRVCRK